LQVEEEPIENHTWVNVYGVLRVMGTDSYLAAFDIEQIEDFNQVIQPSLFIKAASCSTDLLPLHSVHSRALVLHQGATDASS